MKNKIKEYIKKKTKWGISSDILFFLVIVAMLIPTSRTAIIVGVKKATMFSPRQVELESRNQLSESDYDWTIKDLNGEIIELTELKDKVLFINFWATWCPPCIAEMPSVQKLYNQYKSNDQIVFIFVCNDEKEYIEAFLFKRGYSLPTYQSLNKVPEKLSTRSIPRTFIVSKSGEIVLDKTGSAKWHGDKMIEMIDQLVSEF